MKKLFIIISIAILSLMTENACISAQEYDWGTLPAGGGGYITGIIAHPKEKDLMYIRTDVGGIYSFESEPEEYPGRPYWRQIMEWITANNNSLWSTDGIAINPMNANEIYAALGPGAGDDYINSDPYPQGVYKSSDRGQTWTQVLNKRFRGNQGHRSTGECIAVCPEGTGNVVLVGTRFEGLYRSTTNGASWKRVTSIPTDSKGVGIRCVSFDSKNPSNVWLTAYNSGVYYSNDKGESFTLLDGTASINPREVKVASDGTVWITSKNGVYKYSNGALTKNNPSSLASDYNGITIDEDDPNFIVISQMLSAFHTKVFRSTDGGKTWKSIMSNAKFTNNVPWYRDEHMGAAIAAVLLNPFNPKELWFTDWYLPWKTDDITATPVYFESIPWGVEELVIFDIAAPPSGALLYNGCADNGGLRHDSMTDYPTVRFGEQESTGIDFCESMPKSLVRVSSNGWGASGVRVSRSDDAGESWRTVYSPNTTGKVAFSSNNTSNYIFIPTGKSTVPLMTEDDGKTWITVSGLPQNTWNSQFWSNYNKALVSDRKNGEKYYAYISGSFYRSTDSGKSFSKTYSGLPTPSSSETPQVYMATSPYEEGIIWISIGGKGLWFSEDNGQSFTKIDEFTGSKTVAIGPPMPNSNHPTIFSYAYDGNLWGVYRSTDNGGTWDMITDESWNASNNPRQLAADRTHPGRIYIGTGGRGIYCGRLRDEPSGVIKPESKENIKVDYDSKTHNLTIHDEDGKLLSVYNQEGILIAGGELHRSTVFSLPATAKGIIIITITNKDGKIKSLKLIV